MWSGDLDDGWLEAHLPVETVSAIDAVLAAAARRVCADRAPGDDRTMDQLRADLFAAPFLKALETGVLDGEQQGALGRLGCVRPHVQLIVQQGEPGELTGLGPVSAALTRALASLLTPPGLGVAFAVSGRREGSAATAYL